MFKVFIDPGHGGSDPGANAFGLREKDITLKIARALCDELIRIVPCRFKLSRRTDKTLSLRERTDMANQWGADLLVSIHVNAGGGKGFESFIFNGHHPKKALSSHFQTSIHRTVLKQSGWSDRGEKQANFHMLREARMPAILTENGFIDHPQDVAKLKQSQFIKSLAVGHAQGIVVMLTQLQADIVPGNQATYKVKKGDTLWDIARRHHMTLAQISEQNPGVDPYTLQIGQAIHIDAPGKSSSPYHTIVPGDTLWSLAERYKTTTADLERLNTGIDPRTLQIGQRIKVG